MNDETERPVVRLRVVFGPEAMLGPGKAELLERIDRTGSISAAGREMGMSYKRAWMLVGTLNAMFQEPLVHSVRGGNKGGGAVLTPLGQKVLQLYREVEHRASEAGASELAHLQALLSDMAAGK